VVTVPNYVREAGRADREQLHTCNRSLWASTGAVPQFAPRSLRAKASFAAYPLSPEHSTLLVPTLNNSQANKCLRFARPFNSSCVSSRTSHCGDTIHPQVRGGQSGTGAGFVRVLSPQMSVLVPRTAPSRLSDIRGCYNEPFNTKGLSLIQPRE
jgi:hypothetical protein